MKPRVDPVLRIAVPLRVLAERFTLFCLLCVGVGMMALSRAEAPIIERTRMIVADAIAPILSAATRPLATAADAIEAVQGVFDLRAENHRLREQVERLQNWQMTARRLEAENSSLRTLLNVSPEPSLAYASARVIGDSGGAFVRSVLVDAGASQGVKRGQPAINSDGLIGRVAEVGERSSRVLLITDLNSQVPVVLETSRERAILSGDNSARPKLVLLASSARPSPGERVVTSGVGGVFPPGLPIGLIASAGDGPPRVLPFVDFHRLEHLRLVDYGLEGVIEQTVAPGRQRKP